MMERLNGRYRHMAMAASRARHKVAPALVAGAVILVSSGCGEEEDTPSATEETAYSEELPAIGEPVEFFLYTHCGVESLRLGGQWWHAVEPLYGDGGPGTAPKGWGDPYEKGELTRESEQRVTFESEGTDVSFVPAPDDRPMTECR